MNNESRSMRDPTGEQTPLLRVRKPPPDELSGSVIGLLSISKERSTEFLDTIERRFTERGLKVLRFIKPTYTKPAPESLIQVIVEKCDVAVVGLAD